MHRSFGTLDRNEAQWPLKSARPGFSSVALLALLALLPL
jgi:hypothetical protein